MEDHTYHFEPYKVLVLGEQIMEVFENIAVGKPRLEIHPLAIGGKEDKVLLILNDTCGPMIYAAWMNLCNRFRPLLQQGRCVRTLRRTAAITGCRGALEVSAKYV